MKVIHLIPSINDSASGTDAAVTSMFKSQWGAGINVQLFTIGTDLSENTRIETFPISYPPIKLGISNQMYQRLSTVTEKADGPVIMHSHGMWTMQGYYPYLIRKKNSKSRLIFSPHGTLSSYSLATGSKFKPLYWLLLQKSALNNADCIHATSELEYEDIRRSGIKKPVAIIPHGIKIIDKIQRPKHDTKTFLFLGRIHPEKGLELLLRSWGEVVNRLDGWRLRIVGPDTIGYKRYLELFVEEYKIKGVSFEPAIYDEAKFKLFKEIDVMILPSPSENFGLVVAEALCAGIPVITTTGTPWKILEKYNAGWNCNYSVASLIEKIEAVAKYDFNERRIMGANGRKLIINFFNIDAVTDQMVATYKWMVNDGPQPSFVLTD